MTMNKAIIVILSIWATVLITLGTITNAKAEEFQTEIQFSYFGTGQKAATSYMVRSDGAPVCQISQATEVTGTPDAFVANCVTEAFKEGTNNVTMLANLADGGLSPASAVFPFYLDYQVTIIQLTIQRADGSSTTVTLPVQP